MKSTLISALLGVLAALMMAHDSLSFAQSVNPEDERQAGQDVATPVFEMWVQCVERGPYPGRAVANVSYRYDGAFAIQAEDARYFGDTETGDTIVFPFSVQPGEHLRENRINVGAMKAVLIKIVLFGKLHVLPVWDNPDVPDCPLLPEATATPTARPDA